MYNKDEGGGGCLKVGKSVRRSLELADETQSEWKRRCGDEILEVGMTEPGY